MPSVRNSRVVLRDAHIPLGENFLAESTNYAYFCPLCGAIWGRLESGAEITRTNRFIVKNEYCGIHGGGSFLPQLDWGDYSARPDRRRTLQALPVELLLYEVNLVINQLLKGKTV